MASKRQISITMDEDLLDRIRDEADHENRSISNFIESAMVEWYELKLKRAGVVPQRKAT